MVIEKHRKYLETDFKYSPNSYYKIHFLMSTLYQYSQSFDNDKDCLELNFKLRVSITINKPISRVLFSTAVPRPVIHSASHQAGITI